MVPSWKGYLNSSCIHKKDSKAKKASLTNKMRRKGWNNPDPMSAWKALNSIAGGYPQNTDKTFFLYLFWRFCRWYLLNMCVCHMYKYMHIYTYTLAVYINIYCCLLQKGDWIFRLLSPPGETGLQWLLSFPFSSSPEKPQIWIMHSVHSFMQNTKYMQLSQRT